MAAPTDDDAWDAVAAELYALPPSDFTAARNAARDDARASGRDDARALADRIQTLRKPSVAAWAVTLLARAGLLDDVLDLAAALRDAQDDLDAAELSRLGGQRRALVAALARQAVDLAAGHDVTVSSAARVEVEKTLNAAVTDAAAAAAVRSGRLVRALESTGFDPVDVSGAVGGSAPPAALRPDDRDDLAERRARREAERRVREAEKQAADAARILTRAQAAATAARDRADGLRERASALRLELSRVETDADDAGAAADRLERDRQAAAEAAAAAEEAADAARAASPVTPED